MHASAMSHPRTRVVESFQNAAQTIGPLVPGMALFTVTRGQFSMVDAIFYLLDQVGTAQVSLWPRTVAVSKGDILARILRDDRVTTCRLVMHAGDEKANAVLVAEWQARYGPDAIRHCRTHAKIATVEGGGLRFLLRGSLNLGQGSRFEQFDLTEGGDDFALIRGIEEGLPSVGCGAVAVPQLVMGRW